MADRYLGLMSGTSLDGIDAAILDFSTGQPRLNFSNTYDMPDALRDGVLAIVNANGASDVDTIGRLDNAFGHAFARIANQAVLDAGMTVADIAAIGSHGQTLWHAPDGESAFTWQIGDPSVIAALTNLPVVADFRRKDMALGGQGAPLASGFHREIFAQLQPVAVINLGGIANITVLADETSIGFDTGPANGLMDAWFAEHHDARFDRDGEWARSGKVIQPLLDEMLKDPFFDLPPPRSTGREHFNADWIRQRVHARMAPVDVQATLCELSATTVADSINRSQVEHAVIVGGGAHNPFLLERISAHLDHARLKTSDHHGFDPDYIEAGAFAWLARQRCKALPGNLPGVTGASRESVLGAIYLP